MSPPTPEQQCRTFCAHTRRYVYDGDPGTCAEPAEARRCHHHRVWVCVDTVEIGRAAVDVWERLSPVWTPVRYRRARAALRSKVSERNTP